MDGAAAEDARPEEGHRFTEGERPRAEGIPCDDVQVDDVHAVPGPQQGRDGRLAAGDAPREPYNLHGVGSKQDGSKRDARSKRDAGSKRDGGRAKPGAESVVLARAGTTTALPSAVS